MRFIGDVHGKFELYRKISGQAERSLQVGDIGLYSFPEHKQVPVRPGHFFFRGNHDNPAVCRRHPSYLGDYGFMEVPNMFWVAGGYSIDHPGNPRVARPRTMGHDWWPDEELDWSHLRGAIRKYGEVKPRIMVSHECPTSFKAPVLSRVDPDRQRKMDALIGGTVTSRTEMALEEMFQTHKPEVWIFGHYHIRVSDNIEGTKIECLGSNFQPEEQLYYDIPELAWS
jgi:hypothetical protein